jgi:hypothetical protein
VTKLHASVSEEFGRENLIARVRSELAAAQQIALENGLAISVNAIPLGFSPARLLESTELAPAHRLLTLNGSSDAPVVVNLYAGLGPSEPSDAGWYVYCNGRLVLRADKSLVTGWGEAGEAVVPIYHNRSARFRGYCFFDSDDAAKLPWNTTKTGVDGDSTIYRGVRALMITMMRPVLGFLRDLERETTESPDDKPLQDLVETSAAVAVTAVPIRETFAAPLHVRRHPVGPPTGRIQYSKPVEQINRVKEALGVTTYTAVGEKTFEYFYRLECDE